MLNLFGGKRQSKKKAQNKLNKAQRLARLCRTGAMLTTPIAKIEVKLDLLPLNLIIKREDNFGIFGNAR